MIGILPEIGLKTIKKLQLKVGKLISTATWDQILGFLRFIDKTDDCLQKAFKDIVSWTYKVEVLSYEMRLPRVL